MQISFIFLVPAHLGRHDKGSLNGCVCCWLLDQCVFTRFALSQASTQIYRLLLRRSKLRADISIWIGFVTLLFRNGKTDDARKVYDQSLLSLDRKRRKLLSSSYSMVCCPLLMFIYTPSVLWRCWLGVRKGIRPVKNWVVGCWRDYLSAARCRLTYGPADATATHCLLLQ